MYEFGLTVRDTNDLSRRPSGPPVRVAASAPEATTSSRAFAGETAEDIKQRHAESSPENPQGGRWVKFRLQQGGVTLPPRAARIALAAMGYREDEKDGD